MENKQVKGATLAASIRWKPEGKKCSATFFKVLERKNMQNQTRSEFILMIINQNILASLLTFSNLQKNFYEKFCTKEATFETATTKFLRQILNRKNISNEQFHFCEATKSINSWTNNKFPGNDGITAEFYEHFSN